MMPTPVRTAVVLFNLGGPDQVSAIRPFLRNLFSDPAILRVPFFIRYFLARWITRVRLKPATENYQFLGGKSPLLALTEMQARALEAALGEGTKCFIAMRYWHPMSLATARAVADYQPDQIFLLPLYPQYSTATTASSLTAWREAAATIGLVAPTTTLCCYADDAGYAKSIAGLLQETLNMLAKTATPNPIRVLFSAHGLPESIIRRGDPYQHQVERSVAAVLEQLPMPVDWVICYQSRATPQKWLEPSTEDEIRRAGQDQVTVVIVPIAFVSDHVETLVELDIEYRQLASAEAVPGYHRVPVPNDNQDFITALADLVRRGFAQGPGLCAHQTGNLCPALHRQCPHHLQGSP